LKQINTELSYFFKFEACEPLLFLLDNRKDLDLIWGRGTEKWFVGAFKNNCIYILNPNVYERESSHKQSDFWVNLKHEYCHAYYTQITKTHYPVWLNEGLASYLSGKKLVITDSDKEKLLNLFNYFDKVDKDVYTVGQFWVEYLINKYGQNKFLKLIKSFDANLNSRLFSQKFYQIYGFKFTKKEFAKFIN